MPRFPQVPPDVIGVSVSGRGLYILSGKATRLFPGTLPQRLFPLLDGTHSLRELRRSVAKDHREAVQLSRLLRGLAAQGHLAMRSEAATRIPLPSTTSRVIDGLLPHADNHFPGGVTQLQEENGYTTPVQLSPILQPQGLAALIVGDITDPAIERYEFEARRSKRPWILLQPGGLLPVLGPCFVPDEAGCWHCLAHHISECNPTRAVLRHLTGRDCFPPLIPSLCPETVTWFLETLLTRSMQELQQHCAHGLWSHAADSSEPCFHPLRPRPQCPHCGNPERFNPIRNSAPELKNTERLGHGRSKTLAEVGKNLTQLIDPLLGPVLQIQISRNDTASPIPYFSCSASHADTLNPKHADPLAVHSNSSGGHGADEASATGAALCEAVERLSTCYRGEEYLIHARADQLDAAYVGPPALEHFSAEQLAESESLENPIQSGWKARPAPWSPCREMPWTLAWNFTRGEPVHVPAEYAYFGVQSSGNQANAICSSNGVASGSTLVEASVFAFLELVERDAVALWWYSRARRPAVDPRANGSISELSCSGNPSDPGIAIELLDLTHDFGIPVVAAVACDPVQKRSILGFGCHFDLQHAAQKAIGEVRYQASSVCSAAAKRDPLQQFLRDRSMEPPPFLRAAEHTHCNPPDPTRPKSTHSFSEALEWCVHKTCTLNMEMLHLDLTRPDFRWPVARVMIPELRHFWPRFGRGRLYETPVKLGWIANPLTIDALNPVPLTL